MRTARPCYTFQKEKKTPRLWSRKKAKPEKAIRVPCYYSRLCGNIDGRDGNAGTKGKKGGAFLRKKCKNAGRKRQIVRAVLSVVADWGTCRYMQINLLKIFLEERNCRPIFAVSKRYND